MQKLETSARRRLGWVDFARGIVMMLMALDHASLFWNRFRVANEGLGGSFPRYPGTLQMLVRISSHVTPVAFLFLAGMMMSLSGERRRLEGKSEGRITLDFMARGCVLLVLQFTVVNFGFMPSSYAALRPQAVFFLDVLFCIGSGMVLLSLLRRAGEAFLLALAAGLLFVYPLFYEELRALSCAGGLTGAAAAVLFSPNVSASSPVACLYPVFPWFAMMAAGYLFGCSFLKKSSLALEKGFFRAGSAMALLFLILRTLNSYGNALFWRDLTPREFLALSKYPPSLSYFLFSGAVMCFLFLLSVKADKIFPKKSVLSEIVMTFGRVPLFFYCAHIILLGAVPHLLKLGRRGGLMSAGIAWAAGLLALYYPCRWFGRLKSTRPGSLLRYI